MSQGKATNFFAAAMLLCVLLIHTNIANNAATFNVGDSSGWGFSVGTWPNGRAFKAGDILVLKYPTGVQNVVVVDKNRYDTCNSDGGKEFSPGNDNIALVKGNNYFICGVPGHCPAGTKIAVTATLNTSSAGMI